MDTAHNAKLSPHRHEIKTIWRCILRSLESFFLQRRCATLYSHQVENLSMIRKQTLSMGTFKTIAKLQTHWRVHSTKRHEFVYHVSRRITKVFQRYKATVWIRRYIAWMRTSEKWKETTGSSMRQIHVTLWTAKIAFQRQLNDPLTRAAKKKLNSFICIATCWAKY